VDAVGEISGGTGTLMNPNPSSPAVVQTKSGALVGMFNVGNLLKVILYHPNISGAQHQVVLATQPAGPLAIPVALYAFPNGEIAFQFNDASVPNANRWIGAAFCAGTATPPLMLSPTAAGAPGPYETTRNL